MTINKTEEGSKVTFTLRDRFDNEGADRLENELKHLRGSVRELVFDLEGVDYICSAGLRVLLSAQKKMNRKGPTRVINVRKTVMAELELRGFDDFMSIETLAGEEEA